MGLNDKKDRIERVVLEAAMKGEWNSRLGLVSGLFKEKVGQGISERASYCQSRG